MNAYDAGWQARLEGKPFNQFASKDWKDGWNDCEFDMSSAEEVA